MLHTSNKLFSYFSIVCVRVCVCACVSLCVLCPGQNVRPLNKQEYVLDIATEAEEVDSNYSFWFRRVVWTQPLKFDNELCVSMHYNQVPETAALSRCC